MIQCARHREGRNKEIRLLYPSPTLDSVSVFVLHLCLNIKPILVNRTFSSDF